MRRKLGTKLSLLFNFGVDFPFNIVPMKLLTLFRRRSSPRRLSRKGRSEPSPTGNQGRGAAENNDEGATPAEQRSSPPTPPPQHHNLNPSNYDDKTPSLEAKPHAHSIDVYEDRIEELGELMAEQGRCLDEVTNRSRRLSTENNMLREKLSNRMASKPGSSASPTMSPLKNVINITQRRRKDENNTSEDALRFKEENSLLLQQADLLTTELTESNRLIAERDASLASLGKELSSCLEKARSRKIHSHTSDVSKSSLFFSNNCTCSRSVMMEKKVWKASELQKVKEVEALHASVKRSSTLRCEISLRLAERNELEAEVADMGSQVR